MEKKPEILAIKPFLQWMFRPRWCVAAGPSRGGRMTHDMGVK